MANGYIPYVPGSTEEKGEVLREKAGNRGTSSIRLPGGMWLDANSAKPLANLITLGALIYHDQNNVGTVLKKFAQMATENPVTNAAEDLSTARSNPVQYVKNEIAKVPSQMIPQGITDLSAPAAALAGRPSVERHPEEAKNDFWQSMIQQAQEKVPIAREGLPARHNAFGDVEPTHMFKFADPFNIREGRNENTINELERMHAGLGLAQRKPGESVRDYEARQSDRGDLLQGNIKNLFNSDEYQTPEVDEEGPEAQAGGSTETVRDAVRKRMLDMARTKTTKGKEVDPSMLPYQMMRENAKRMRDKMKQELLNGGE